jgi:hypothetical protein
MVSSSLLRRAIATSIVLACAVPAGSGATSGVVSTPSGQRVGTTRAAALPEATAGPAGPAVRTREAGSLQDAYPKAKVAIYHAGNSLKTTPYAVTPDGLVLVQRDGDHGRDIELLDPVSGHRTRVRTLHRDRYGNGLGLIDAAAHGEHLAWMEGSDYGKADAATWAVMVQDRRTGLIRQIAHSPMPATAHEGTCRAGALVLGAGRLWWSG